MITIGLTRDKIRCEIFVEIFVQNVQRKGRLRALRSKVIPEYRALSYLKPSPFTSHSNLLPFASYFNRSFSFPFVRPSVLRPPLTMVNTALGGTVVPLSGVDLTTMCKVSRADRWHVSANSMVRDGLVKMCCNPQMSWFVDHAAASGKRSYSISYVP